MNNFEIINPITWSDTMLTSSTASEVVPLWSVGSTYAVGTQARLDTTHKIYECLVPHASTNGTSATVTMTIAAPCVVTWTAHGLVAGADIVFTSTGSLPTGLSVGVTYYVLAPTANTFNVAATSGGAAITTIGAQSGTHTATRASTRPDLSLTGDLPKWLEVGATNQYAMFDAKWGTQTTATSTLTVEVTPSLAIDSLALLNLLGEQVSITCRVAGVVKYSRTISLQTDVGVYDWLTYFVAPIVAQDDVVVSDLLPYNLQVITITITGPGTVAIGNLSMGSTVSLGRMLASPSVSIVDYSRKETDDYGNVVITQRAYSKRFSGRIVVDDTFVDQLTSILASIRSTPVVWVGSAKYSSLIVWGFYKDFEVDVAFSTHSFCTITIEGLV